MHLLKTSEKFTFNENSFRIKCKNFHFRIYYEEFKWKKGNFCLLTFTYFISLFIHHYSALMKGEVNFIAHTHTYTHWFLKYDIKKLHLFVHETQCLRQCCAVMQKLHVEYYVEMHTLNKVCRSLEWVFTHLQDVFSISHITTCICKVYIS